MPKKDIDASQPLVWLIILSVKCVYISVSLPHRGVVRVNVQEIVILYLRYLSQAENCIHRANQLKNYFRWIEELEVKGYVRGFLSSSCVCVRMSKSLLCALQAVAAQHDNCI